MTIVVGADGFHGGWAAVVMSGAAVAQCALFSDMAGLLAAHPEAAVVAVDIPIGPPERGRRRADVEARRFLGGRAGTVFMTPPRTLLETADYAEARARARALRVAAPSSQAYALGRKILEVDRLAVPGGPLFEVHSEVSFAAMSAGPLPAKRSWNGLWLRRRLLERHGIALPDDLDEAGSAPPDDLLDAAAAAWSARRIARGEAVSLPSPPDIDGRGRQVAIWF